MEEEQKEAMPALYEHCAKVYAAMHQLAGVCYEQDATEPQWVYEGHLTRLFSDLGLSTPYYTSVRKKLLEMDCIRQLRRGGGNSLSRWLLVQKPTEELFQASVALRSPRKDRLSRIEQQVKDLSVTVATLYGKVNAMTGTEL
jgi:hypothetical protein